MTGAERLPLRVTDSGDGDAKDHSDWGDAALRRARDALTARPFAGPVP
ncbi:MULTISPECIES: NPCBM/NEW2 domain-containing protein [unclassified Streptomyces]|nr:NPCBM/NEW2 domain-containing protein [Streptomyces sp. NBC_01257]